MIVQTYCGVFAQNLLRGTENFNTGTPYTYKIALYTANANLSGTTSSYTSIDEITGTGYTAGGKVLTPVVPALDPTNNTAYISFANAVWTPAVFTARGALVYNSTTGAACFVLDFGSDKTASSTFTVTFPAASSTNAIIRIS
jgi:hypothetical protein